MMQPALDLSRLPPPAQKILSPGAPPALRLVAARGVVPGLKPADLVAVVAALTESDDAAIAAQASATLGNLPPPVLTGALAADLEPGVIDALARVSAGRDEVLAKLAAMPRVTGETLAHLAATGSEALTEIIATNEARLLAEPAVIERLYHNKHVRMSTVQRLIELAYRNNVEVKGIPAFKEQAIALQDELIPEPSDEPDPLDLMFLEIDQMAQSLEDSGALAPDDLLEDLHDESEPAEGAAPEAAPTPMLAAAQKGAQKKKEEAGPLHARMAEMSISERIRMATIGPSAARALLLRDTNKLVANAAISSPMVQEQDVERISRMRTVHEEVLRYICSQGRWTETHAIKFNLVSNPRTPVASAAKFVMHLREDELKRLEKNRDVSAPVRSLIKQQIQRKAKKPAGK